MSDKINNETARPEIPKIDGIPKIDDILKETPALKEIKKYIAIWDILIILVAP